MTASSSLSPSGSHRLAPTLASELSAVGSRPFTLLVIQLSWLVGSNPDSSAGKPSPSWGSWPLSLTLFPYHHHPANTPCGSLMGNGTLPHSNITVSVCPQIKAQSLSCTDLRPMDSEWEVGAAIAPCVSVCTLLVHGAQHPPLRSPAVATVPRAQHTPLRSPAAATVPRRSASALRSPAAATVASLLWPPPPEPRSPLSSWGLCACRLPPSPFQALVPSAKAAVRRLLTCLLSVFPQNRSHQSRVTIRLPEPGTGLARETPNRYLLN